jgi:hypothetical protein
MVKISSVLLVASLLLSGCSCGCPDPAMRITGYGRGNVKSEATRVAWSNARQKLSSSGLKGYALVEDNTTFGRGWWDKVFTVTIKFCVVPAQPAAESASANESVEPSN